MLRIDDDLVPQVWVDHEATGTRFLIRPVEPKDAQRLLKAARDKTSGELDNVKYNGLAAAHLITDWEGVGQDGALAPCSTAARVKFGERFGRIVSFLMDRATDMKMFSDEVDAAKNA